MPVSRVTRESPVGCEPITSASTVDLGGSPCRGKLRRLSPVGSPPPVQAPGHLEPNTDEPQLVHPAPSRRYPAVPAATRRHAVASTRIRPDSSPHRSHITRSKRPATALADRHSQAHQQPHRMLAQPSPHQQHRLPICLPINAQRTPGTTHNMVFSSSQCGFDSRDPLHTRHWGRSKAQGGAEGNTVRDLGNGMRAAGRRCVPADE